MKITDSDSIKDGENEFIDGLIGELDWQAIEVILKEKYNIKLHDDVEFKKGDMVVHGKRIAYKLDFDVRVTLSLIIGRDGECIDIKASGGSDEDEKKDELTVQNEEAGQNENLLKSNRTEPGKHAERQRKNDEMAFELSEIIKEINK